MSWLGIQMAVLDAASDLVSFAMSWLLQSTLLIVAGLAIAWLLHRRGSALQSAIYRTTLVTVIICPLASGLLALAGGSGWSLPMPAAWTYEESSAPVVTKAEPAGTSVIVGPQTPERSKGESMLPQARRPDGGRTETEVGFASEPPRAPLSYGPMESVAGIGPVPGHMPAPESSARSGVAPSIRSAATSLRRFHVRAFGMVAIGIVLTWMSASAWLLVRLRRAWRRLNRLCGEAVPAEPAIQDVCRELTALLDVVVPRVLRSPYLSSPCLAGWPRPTVLLPEADPSQAFVTPGPGPHGARLSDTVGTRGRSQGRRPRAGRHPA